MAGIDPACNRADRNKPIAWHPRAPRPRRCAGMGGRPCPAQDRAATPVIHHTVVVEPVLDLSQVGEGLQQGRPGSSGPNPRHATIQPAPNRPKECKHRAPVRACASREPQLRTHIVRGEPAPVLATDIPARGPVGLLRRASNGHAECSHDRVQQSLQRPARLTRSAPVRHAPRPRDLVCQQFAADPGPPHAPPFLTLQPSSPSPLDHCPLFHASSLPGVRRSPPTLTPQVHQVVTDTGWTRQDPSPAWLTAMYYAGPVINEWCSPGSWEAGWDEDLERTSRWGAGAESTPANLNNTGACMSTSQAGVIPARLRGQPGAHAMSSSTAVGAMLAPVCRRAGSRAGRGDAFGHVEAASAAAGRALNRRASGSADLVQHAQSHSSDSIHSASTLCCPEKPPFRVPAPAFQRCQPRAEQGSGTPRCAQPPQHATESSP